MTMVMSMVGHNRSASDLQSTATTNMDVSRCTESSVISAPSNVSAHHHHHHHHCYQQQSPLSRKLLLQPTASDKKQSKINWVRLDVFASKSLSTAVNSRMRLTAVLRSVSMEAPSGDCVVTK